MTDPPRTGPPRTGPPRTAKSVLVVGGTGTAGQATVRALVEQGYRVTCLIRRAVGAGVFPSQIEPIIADVTRGGDDLCLLLKGRHFDVVVSCLASRTGTPKDAWAIDHRAQLSVLELAQRIGAAQFVLLSAICVQKPKLAFQAAKLAFEETLIGSGLTYSIVRPTAFFKSLSGQIERVRSGRPFLVFGDGRLTQCTPISDDDLGHFIAGCISDDRRHNRILPIGGPGPAISPMDQAAEIFRLLGRPAKIRRVPVGILTAIIGLLRVGGLFSAKLAEKAELARIGRYYATESMLVWDPGQNQYDRDLTPSFGSDLLFHHYARLIENDLPVERTEHSVF